MVDEAKARIEQAASEVADKCLEPECGSSACLDAYLQDKVTGEHFVDLKRKAKAYARSSRCKIVHKPPPPEPCAYANISGFEMRCRTNFGGYVVDSKVPPFYNAADVEQCAAFCRERSDCKAFNINPDLNGSCFLYKSYSTKRYDSSRVSGFR